MATQRIPILGSGTFPDNSGEVFQEPYTITATNDTWDPMVWVFTDGSTRTGLYGTFEVPTAYVDTANLIVVWTSTATAGSVEWDFDYRVVTGSDATSLDQATAQESVNDSDTAPSAAHERMVKSIALTDGNVSANSTVEFFLARDKSDAGDDMAAKAILFSALFEFNDL